MTEALIHVLVEKNILTRGDALDIIQTSAEVKEEIMSAASEPREVAQASLALLTRMGLSFERIPPGGGDGHGPEIPHPLRR